jgi:hypothetical protein
MNNFIKFIRGYTGFFSFYGVYLQIILAIGAIAVGIIDRNLIIKNWPFVLLIFGAVFLVPFLVLGLSRLQGTFAKSLRLFIFSAFRVETFAGFGLIILLLFTGLFILNLSRGFYDGPQIFLNVLFLNLLFLYFLALVYTKKFQIKQPSDLLIRNNGHAEVYLYQDGTIRHIPDPETLSLLGYSFEEVVDINDTEFATYKRKAALDSAKTARLVQEEGNSEEVWMIFGDRRRLIPDPYTLDFIQRLGKRPINIVTREQLNQWKVLNPIISILKLMRVII